jgi:hypothetical protein
VLFRLRCTGAFGANRALLNLGKPTLQEVVLSKTKSIFQENNVPGIPASKTDVFLSRDTWVSSTQLKRPILNK